MIKVVKIGGNVVDNEELLGQFCKSFAALEGPKVLVHGGGVLASRMQEKAGIPARMVSGRRITDEATLQIVTMVYAGWCSKHICALLQKEDCNAMGLSGCDGNVIRASKRPPIAVEGTMVDFGQVGDVKRESVNADALRQLLDAGFVPVLNAINHDGGGHLLNTNADTVASSVAAALGAELIICFEKPGVLLDKNDDGSLLREIDGARYRQLLDEGRIDGGMLPKLENAFKVLGQGVPRVVIQHSSAPLGASGTSIRL